MKSVIEWQKYASIIICTVAAGAAAYLLFKYVIGLIMPFILGWLVSLAVVPLSGRLSKKTKIPKKVWAALLVILIIAVLSLLAVFGVNRLLYELQELVARIGEDSDSLGEWVEKVILKIGDALSKIPFFNRLAHMGELENLRENINATVSSVISDSVASLTSKIPSIAAWLFSAAPACFLFVAAVVISAFYFSTDCDLIRSGISSVCPQKIRNSYAPIRDRIKKYALRYLKAYMLLFLLTAAELFIGFMIIGVDYALLLAILVAILDLLPILGVGTALVPWALVSFIGGDVPTSVGLIILYGIMMIVRQMAEPKLVGKSLGIHPLIMLIAVYIGIKLFGLLGAFIGPAAAIVVRAVFRAGQSGDDGGSAHTVGRDNGKSENITGANEK